MKKYINKRSILFCISIISFFTIMILFLIKKDLFVDYHGYRFVSSFSSTTLTKIMKIITICGSAKFLIGLTLGLVIVFLIRKRYKYALFVSLNILFAHILNTLIKQLIRRNRPVGHRLVSEKGYSFPSGHSTVSLAVYSFLIFLIYRNVKNKYLKVTLIVLLSILIFLIGFSRIYLGVHFTSDVLAGYLLSISYINIFIYLCSKNMEKEKVGRL